MEWFAKYDIGERDLDLLNPCSPEKIGLVGEALRLRAGMRVVEFGCGHGEVLAQWAQRFGITGVGVELRQAAYEHAVRKIAERGLGERVSVFQGDGAAFAVEPGSCDVAACIGASFIWGGFEPTLDALEPLIHDKGRIAVGEPYWVRPDMPVTYSRRMAEFRTEPELLAACRERGLTIAAVVRGSHDDWDRYISGNLQGTLAWLDENPDHPERAEVIGWLSEWQDDYFGYEREYIGWAIYVLARMPAE